MTTPSDCSSRFVTPIVPGQMAPSPQLASISPMFASALEGKKRATLSDTENLCVGAFGGVLETVIQSAPRSR